MTDKTGKAFIPLKTRSRVTPNPRLWGGDGLTYNGDDGDGEDGDDDDDENDDNNDLLRNNWRKNKEDRDHSNVFRLIGFEK